MMRQVLFVSDLVDKPRGSAPVIALDRFGKRRMPFEIVALALQPLENVYVIEFTLLARAIPVTYLARRSLGFQQVQNLRA